MTALFEKTPGSVDTPPPLLGEHNSEIYTALDISAAEQSRLKTAGVI